MTREEFLKTYANIPINLRQETILIINEQPITWNVAYLEISHNTKLGKEILKKLNLIWEKRKRK